MDANWITTTILNSIDGFFDWHLNTGQIILSSTFKTLLGYTKEELASDNKYFFQENLHAQERDKILNEFSIIFNGHRERFSKEMRLKHKNGSFVWIRLQGKIFRDSQSKAQRFSGIALNVDEQRQNLSLETSQTDDKTRFVTMLNHDMRSPLAAIISTSHLIVEEPLSPKQAKYIRNIEHSADLLLKLVNDILDIAKLDAGKLSIEFHPFSIDDMLQSVIAMMMPGYEEKGLFLKVNSDASLPPLVVSDSTRLQQLLVNFLSNALKFTQTGGITLNTNYTPISTSKGKLYIEVVDTGVGISVDTIPMLFKEYTQADISTSRVYGGTGLGLAICKKLISLLGGEIGARSQEESGSTFWFEITVDLPLQKNTTQSQPSSKLEKSILKKLHILVAEDNAVNQEVMIGLLERLGHTVVIAANGQLAVDFIQKNTFDVILMDINMPILDGVEACQAIRQFNKNIPIIAVTANSLESEKKRCLDAGMNHFMTKPVDKTKLSEMLRPFQHSDALTSSPNTKTEGIPKKMSSEIFVNLTQFNSLMSDLGENRLKKLIMLYKQDAPGLIENLKNNIEPERSAHTLAGMSENLNFTALSQKSRAILSMVRENEGSPDYQALIADLPSVYAHTLQSLESILPPS